MASMLLILLGATVPLPADLLPDPKISLLPPVNFTVGVAGLAQVLLRWEANPAQELGSAALGYQVKIHAPEEVDYETPKTQSRRAITLHQGLSASVRTILLAGGPDRPASPWVSAALDAPPGEAGPERPGGS
ncbi:interleukin-5 receptor subunit alpha-like [Talpa occidentalis]|uniref:interleukin-5 receptor subunit alpha-like n=1 Tax=Talpa occidentalis TaxID=50954 RepID=UPI0023F86219|nr:interleukin-5 receptor subunit alpha-like [Talpa occidentalis]